MAPEILSFPSLVDKKPVVEVLTDTFTSVDTSKSSPLHASLAPLFQENTLAKLLSVAQTYIENDVRKHAMEGFPPFESVP